MLSDGKLEICGRCDSMVKIRGYSVEVQVSHGDRGLGTGATCCLMGNWRYVGGVTLWSKSGDTQWRSR